MASPSDLIPQKYEVLKLRNGLEVVGMTRDTTKGIEITLPMVCKLNAGQTPVETLATFYPYAPLTSDTSVVVPIDHILHRNVMNQQYIPFYDEASSKWLTLVETESIPLTNKMPKMEYIKDTINKLVSGMSDEELDRLEEEQFLEEDSLLSPDDPKKIH